MADDQPAQRSARLSKLLHSYTHGNRSPKSAPDGKLFLEAISAQNDVAGCIERLIASENALAALKLALRLDVSTQFFNGTFVEFVTFLKDPTVGQLCGGQLLKQLLTTIVRPPTLWAALVSAHSNKQLGQKSELCFAWLLLELVSWIESPPIQVESTAHDITRQRRFLNAADRELRSLGYRIEHILRARGNDTKDDPCGPGGRHDNDQAEFRKIAILPTNDELMSKELPFYRPANAITQTPLELRVATHLDNQFRLLREDFLAELREDIHGALGSSKTRRPRTRLQGLALAGVHCGNSKYKVPFALALSVKRGLDRLGQMDTNTRKAFLKGDSKFLKHESFGCVVDQDSIIAFATLIRDEDLLLREQPLIALRTPDRVTLERLLLTLKASDTAEFVMVGTPIFAYEPILRCLQRTVELPLWQELLASCPEEIEGAVRPSSVAPLGLISDIEADEGKDLEADLSLTKPVSLDQSQLQSLLSGLRQSVSLIQGPPGTGKSFIGALLAKALIQHTGKKILVICYTNHALDQFLEDLLDIGIPADVMVRLGGKFTVRTECLQLFKQRFNGVRPYSVINAMKEQAEDHELTLRDMVSSLENFKPDKDSVMELLEFSDDESDFFYALQVPEHDPEEQLIGGGGKRVTKHYLYDRWRHGQDAGVLSGVVANEHEYIWSMKKELRDQKIQAWTQRLLQDRIDGITSLVDAYNENENTLREAWEQKDNEIIRSKRIIACTTTAAAKYNKQLRSAAPGIVVVEEAGEILESHILTALTPHTKQLILIGDHKQLRPKVNNYSLTVEKGEGYDLNRSMFERLILAGFPHTTLRAQHRMCPEISSLVRHLTYPDLIDSPSTLCRDPIRGLGSRVIFIDHRHAEEAASQVADRRDAGAPASKKNAWEVQMVLKIVRYMAQQGYGTTDQVVLTPYLGQLSLLREELAKENDPVLNDMDSFDLIKAGLLSPSSAAQNKSTIKISTIDNYQGEESEVVIASLTRSNSNGDIGFMVSPERLNVLLSRARDCLIIIGNSRTFTANRKGAAFWTSFFNMLAQTNDVYDGLPAKCQQHPERQVILAEPADFDNLCPDGGCSAPCGITLSCGLHDCPQKCHARADHTKMPCQVLVSDQCPKKHKMKWRCSSRRPASCWTCDAEARDAAERQERDLQLDLAREQRQAAYARQLANFQDEINHSRRLLREQREDEERERALRQQEQDLATIRAHQARVEEEKDAAKTAPVTQVPRPSPPDPAPQDGTHLESPTITEETSAHSNNEFWTRNSAAQEDWEQQKRFEGARNEHLDQLMPMIGLENVKEAFLDIKAKVDITVRQDISLCKERFGVSLLGNPGTGKTTVARIYGKFLSSVGALPGDDFVETTGAKLANEGVQGCKKILDGIEKNGGGALFIDEAYQLSSGASFGGATVLDFLLAEVENLNGKVVFILAGYNKNMETFFAHNPGLPSRFPRQIQFADYDDPELLDILVYAIAKRYGQKMQITGGSKGLYTRIVARRLGRGRGKVGFGNARAVENALSVIASRQAKRVRAERRKGRAPDDLLLIKEDLIGPAPSDVLKDNQAWKKLQRLTGLTSVKESVSALFDSISYNFQRELEEEPIMEFSLNKVFLGSPGTGKTTVARLYGQILADIGLLSTNEVIVKTPPDFVGSVLGASEANTKAILDAAIGKVLVIDEAYGLHSASDPYKTAIIDTIVAEVQGVPGDDRCVLLLGYREQMEQMMQNSNPGLARRFPIDSGFLFEDFNDNEMAVIFDAKLVSQSFKATPTARSVALEVLGRMRNRPNFGNAGQVEVLLNDAKIRRQKRFTRDRIRPTAIFEAEDFDPDHKRAERATTNIEKIFEGVVGCEGIVAQMKDYQNIAANMKDAGMDPRAELPFTFLFRGPPGTGKTTTARKMGKIYYDMGFLADAKVIECSAKDLIGEYVGQTGPKAQKLIESALGKVLFVDEAYRLGDGPFAKEAIDELVDCITKPRFLNKVVIILAGYDADINRLMDVNPGLSSRFAESVDFQTLNPDACYQLLQGLLERRNQIDSSVVSSPSASFRTKVADKFVELSSLANFANGRDVETLTKGIVGTIMKTRQPKDTSLTVSEELVITQIEKLITERLSRARSALPITTSDATGGALQRKLRAQDGPSVSRTTASATHDAIEEQSVSAAQIAVQQQSAISEGPQSTPEGPKNVEVADDESSQASVAVRDVGVSDQIWAQLQEDRMKAEEEEKERERLAREAEELKQWLKKCHDAKRQLELDAIERRKQELEEKLRREAQAQARLAKMGCCPVGYQWIRQSGGYRCAGGSHWVSDGQMQHLCG